MAVRTIRNAKRLDAKNIAQVLELLLSQPVIVMSESRGCLSCNVPTREIERDIFVAATPGAYTTQGTAKNKWGNSYDITSVFGGDGKPSNFTPLYLTSLEQTWNLIRRTAPEMRVCCEFRSDGLMEVISVGSERGVISGPTWPIRTPPHALLIALFGYLGAGEGKSS